MSTPVKILVGLAGTILILFIALVAAVAFIVEPGDYRPYLVNAVEDATGRSFEITGELGLDLMPCCSVSLAGARLGNPAGFPGDDFAGIEHAAASLKLWPLLVRQEVEIGSVTLTGMEASLVRLADGRVNWELETPEPGAPDDQPAADPGAISVDSVVLREGVIRYRDEQAGAAYSVTGLQAETGVIAYEGGTIRPFQLETSFQVTDEADGTGAQVALETRLGLEEERLTAGSPTVAVEAGGGAVPGGEASLRARAESLQLTLNVETAVSIGGFSAVLEALASRVTVTGNGTLGGAEDVLAGAITLDETSPRRMLAALPDVAYEPADASALNRLGAEGRWHLTGSTLVLDDLEVRLDDSRLTGSLRVMDLDTLATRFDLAVDRLNLDAYLPPEDPEAEESEAEAEIPVEAIRDLNLNGRLRAGELVLLEMPLNQVLAEVTAADGVLRLDPVTAELYGGEYRGSVAIDATGPKADLQLRQELAAVQVGEILDSFFASDLLAGSLSLKLAGSGAGNTFTELLQGLAADVSLDLSDGAYRGMDVVYELRRARALLADEPAPEAPAERVTPLRSLDARGRLVDGVLQTRELTARTDALQLLGKGGIDLMELALDYEIEARVLEEAASAAGLSGLTGAAIPLTLSGPLTSPTVGVDLKGLVSGALRDTLQQKARDALLERLGEDEQTPPSEGEETEGEEPSAKDRLERSLRDLLRPRSDPSPSEDE